QARHSFGPSASHPTATGAKLIVAPQYRRGQAAPSLPCPRMRGRAREGGANATGLTMLKGKNAVVTGSTSGIGLAIARALAQSGANVMINGFGEASEIEKERAGVGG